MNAIDRDRLPCAAANGLWLMLCLREKLAFRLALRDIAGTQEKALMSLLRRNAETEYGRRYGFATIRSVAEYQERVPLSTYDDYCEAVQRIANGQERVLTREPVLLLEPTSGSTAPTKLIPYTATLKAEFQRAVAAWMADLFFHDPAIMLGQAYWSVSPVARRSEHTAGGLQVGFEEDTEYLSRSQRRLLQSVLAVPPIVRLIGDVPSFRYITLFFLLRSRSLALISVWNPTFLTLLVGLLPEWWPKLVVDIAYGTLSPPAALAPALMAQLEAMIRPDPLCAASIRDAFQSGSQPGSIHARIWPNLRLISCWADAHAASYVPELARLFPQALLQGKGLVATEGFVSFPVAGRTGAALAIRSHLFEFLPIHSARASPRGSRALLAHELELDGCYAVVISTGGGLYRYQLGDLVQVVDHMGGLPLIRFIGREVHISDRFGEKLNERHVRQVLDGVLNRHAVRPTFVMVACEEISNRHAYTLFIEAQGQPDGVLRLLGDELEEALLENYHYGYCRDLGQLDAVRVFRVESGALDVYLSVCQAHGQRLGDIKPVALHHMGDWSRAFRGQMLAGDGVRSRE
jgi:hypothetical protein